MIPAAATAAALDQLATSEYAHFIRSGSRWGDRSHLLSLSVSCVHRASNAVSIKNAKSVTLYEYNKKHILLQFITCFLPVRCFIICQCLVNQVCHLGDIVCTEEKHNLSQILPIVPYVIEDLFLSGGTCV